MGQDHQADGNQAELSVAAAWVCNVCGYVYEEAEGCEADGIRAGTRWDEVPADWCCPDCGVGKNDFSRLD